VNRSGFCAAFLSLFLNMLIACSSVGSERDELTFFCPLNEESTARGVLNIRNAETIHIDELKKRISSLGITFERDQAETELRKECREQISRPFANSYKIYAGRDESKTISRIYLVKTGSSGQIVVIEARHVYPAIVYPEKQAN